MCDHEKTIFLSENWTLLDRLRTLMVLLTIKSRILSVHLQSTPVLQDRCHTWHVEPVSASDVQLEQMVENMVQMS